MSLRDSLLSCPTWSRVFTRSLLSTLICFFVATAAAQPTLPQQSQRLTESGALKAGMMIPWFAGWRFGGDVFNREKLLSGERAGYVLVFSSVLCEGCNDGLELLTSAQNRLSEEGIQIFLIHTGDIAKRPIDQWRRRRGLLGLPLILDRFQVISRDFGLFSSPDNQSDALEEKPNEPTLPRTFVLDRGGKLIELIGFEGYDYIELISRAVRYSTLTVEEAAETPAAEDEAEAAPEKP